MLEGIETNALEDRLPLSNNTSFEESLKAKISSNLEDT